MRINRSLKAVFFKKKMRNHRSLSQNPMAWDISKTRLVETVAPSFEREKEEREPGPVSRVLILWGTNSGGSKGTRDQSKNQQVFHSLLSQTKFSYCDLRQELLCCVAPTASASRMLRYMCAYHAQLNEIKTKQNKTPRRTQRKTTVTPQTLDAFVHCEPATQNKG